MNASRTVHVVPHTHWDREWYQPHELFRWRLVKMIDELLDLMEQHPAFRCFTLDGQTIVVEDYLELRPEHEGRLRALIAADRIRIGPWWVQPDEFLPSAESHVRSFQKGIRWAQRLGGCLTIGHCADQFGHIAQMPQIMAGLGLTSACLWRGVPDTVLGWSFWWEAPDGTRLPVLYLRTGYSNGWQLPADPDDLIERTRREEGDRREGEPALFMAGTDHSRVQKQLPEILTNAAGRGYDFRISSLAEYERALLDAGIDEHVHQGELRSPDRSNVLVGVLSARATIKQRDFLVSALIERGAEPLELLARLHGGEDGLPALRHAWRLLLENSPHDSICGCSVDQTHREMFPRYDRAEQLARQIARESFQALAPRFDVPAGGGVLAFRPVPHAAAVLECWVSGEWDAPALRLPDGREVAAALGPLEPGTVLTHQELSPAGAVRHLDFIREGRMDIHHVESITARLDGTVLRVETVVGDDVNVVEEEPARAVARRTAREGTAERADIVVRRSDRRLLRAVLPASDTIGVELLTPAQAAPATDIRVAETGIANAFYELRWADGRPHLTDRHTGLPLDGVNTFVDEGDRGDEYNADILPDAVSEPLTSAPVRIEGDAVSARLTYRTELLLPSGLHSSRAHRARTKRVRLPILTTVTLWAGVPRVDFTVRVANTARDHRLRALFRLPFRVGHAITENQFHVASRPVQPPPWNGVGAEQPPTTFPQKTFAAFEAGGAGLAVFNKGMQEGEVVTWQGGQAYALTLLRCVGWLSRPDLTTRRGGAGPTIATPEAQMPGEHVYEYALTTYRGSWREARVQPLAHAFAYPVMAYATNAHAAAGDETRGATDRGGGQVSLVTIPSPALVPSAMQRSDVDGAPVFRFYNASGGPLRTSAGIAVPGVARLVDLLERPTGEARQRDGAVELDLRPWQIVSLKMT